MSKLIESTKERDVLVNNGFMYLFDVVTENVVFGVAEIKVNAKLGYTQQ